MMRVKLVVAYDGTDFCGWQLQPKQRTVEGELNRAICELTGEDIRVIGASRTDTGVHALGNVAVFDTESSIPADRFSYALNQKLPEDIRIQNSEEVSADFHPRHCVSVKTYEYSIFCAEFPVPTFSRYNYYTYSEPDVARMQKAAEGIVGTHDFTSFCSAKTDKEDKTRTVYSVSVAEESAICGKGRSIKIEVSGNGFLYNMVRIIAGTLLKVGTGGIEPEEIPSIIEAKDRTKAGPTLPPQGLMLREIVYKSQY